MESEKQQMPLGMGLMIGTAVEFQHTVISLIEEYNSKGITEIPIKVLEQAILEASVKTMGPDGLVGSTILDCSRNKEKEVEQCK